MVARSQALKRSLAALQKAVRCCDAPINALLLAVTSGLLSERRNAAQAASAAQRASGAAMQGVADVSAAMQNTVADNIANAFPSPTDADLQTALLWANQNAALLSQFDETRLGYIHQIWCATQRKETLKTVQSANKNSTVEEIISFTQLYTPDWVCEWLAKETIATVSKSPDEIRLLDPACGAGHMLLAAVSELAAGSNKPVSSLIQENIFGCDIDPKALYVSALTLMAKHYRSTNEFPANLNLILLENQTNSEVPLGTLEKNWPHGHLLNQKFDVVLGNPPYIGRKLLPRALKEQLKANYPDEHSDICVAFTRRGLELLEEGGVLGYITQSSLLYLPTYEKFRQHLLQSYSLTKVVELGTGVFPLQTGEKVNSVLLLIQNNHNQSNRSEFIDLTGTQQKCEHLLGKLQASITTKHQSEFNQHRATAFNFRCPEAFLLLQEKCTTLEQHAEVRQGLATTNNARFVKRIDEVPPGEIGKRWKPYVKGAGSERWYHPIQHVVDWGNDGADIKRSVAETYPYLNGNTKWVVKNEQFYGKEGLTFSFVNSKRLAVRYLPTGCIFDVAGSAVFPLDGDHFAWLAYLNSSLLAAAANLLNPTINFQVGDLKKLPVIPLSLSTKQKLGELGRSCVEAKKRVDTQKLKMLEQEVDALILEEALQQLQFNEEQAAQLRLLCISNSL